MRPRIRLLAALLALLTLPIPLLGNPAAGVTCASAIAANVETGADRGADGHGHANAFAADDGEAAPAGSPDDCPLGVSGHTVCCFTLLPPPAFEVRAADRGEPADAPRHDVLRDQAEGGAPFHPPRA